MTDYSKLSDDEITCEVAGAEIVPIKRNNTVTITRKQFRCICDALAHTVNSKHALLGVTTDGSKLSDNALYAAQEKLQLVERLLREVIK